MTAHFVRPARWRDQNHQLKKDVDAGKFASATVNRWRSDITTIWKAVSSLYVHRQVYDGIGSIIAGNPALQVPNLFLGEMFEWYVFANSVAAALDAECDGRVVSLANVLHEIAEHPEELSRRGFRKMLTGLAYIPNPAPHALGDDPERDDVITLLEPVYGQYADSDDREHLDVSSIRRDLARLSKAAKDVVTFRNEVAAHRAREVSILQLSVASIHEYIDVLDELARKYEKLLFSAAPPTLDPITHERWKEIFSFPWIIPAERGPMIPYAATPDVVKKLFQALRPDERVTMREWIAGQ